MLSTVVAPLFTIVPLAWRSPRPDEVDAVVLTSANAARQAGPKLADFTHLPCYAVGESSAAAAEAAGFRSVLFGPSDGSALAALVADAGLKRPLHLCGRDHVPLCHPGLQIVLRTVYAADPVPALPPEALTALANGAIALLHSPRAAAQFAALVDAAGLARAEITIAAISEAAAASAGDGWRRIASAERPRDDALLELAAKLCKTEAGEVGKEE